MNKLTALDSSARKARKCRIPKNSWLVPFYKYQQIDTCTYNFVTTKGAKNNKYRNQTIILNYLIWKYDASAPLNNDISYGLQDIIYSFRSKIEKYLPLNTLKCMSFEFEQITYLSIWWLVHKSLKRFRHRSLICS